MIVLGTKFYSHDSAFCRIDTERREILALSTERFTRTKHDETPVSVMFGEFPPGEVAVLAHSFNGFSPEIICTENYPDYPDNMLRYVYGQAADKPHEGVVEYPLSVFCERVKEIRHQELKKGVAPKLVTRSCAAAVIKGLLGHAGVQTDIPVKFFDHHLCHAVSAYYSSPFYGCSALVLSVDGYGDGYSGKASVFRGEFYQEIGESPSAAYAYNHTGQYYNVKRPLSVGILYQTFTGIAGFREACDEGKVEALAAFGKPVPEIYDDLMNGSVIGGNGLYLSPVLAARYYHREYLDALITKHGRDDVCATIQRYLEDVIVNYINSLSLPPDIDYLCLAGGVTANIVMNLAIYERTRFKNIHVTPYMGDEGTAVGAAILAARLYGEDVSWISQMTMPYFGPSYTRDEVLATLRTRSDQIVWVDLRDDWPSHAAEDIAQGRIIALFQGQMEFGPRALGNRSILANPVDPTFRERINVSIKRRPPWQPFCPSILESERERLFQDSFSHKHMAIAFRMKPEFAKQLPSAVHIDGTARPQFVSAEDNPSYYHLLQEVKQRTGFGVVINTSFNLHGRAIVMAPNHAIDDFLDCNLDALYIEGFKVTRI